MINSRYVSYGGDHYTPFHKASLRLIPVL